jgi:hypothetical protein
MPRHPAGERYELVIVAQADDYAPAVVRLRHVLKALLRTYGFRCTSCRDVTPRSPAPPPGVAQEAGGDGPTVRPP